MTDLSSQNARGNYKKQTMTQQFYHSCLGKVIILIGAAIVLTIAGAFSIPSDSMMKWQTEDNNRECIQDNDSIRGDKIDEMVGNLRRIFTHADTTGFDREVWDTYHKLNRVEVHRHSVFATSRVYNNIHPSGVRVAIGIWGIVIPTVYYSDLLLNDGPVRGKANERLIQDTFVNDDYIGDNPNLKPYHYKGNPDD